MNAKSIILSIILGSLLSIFFVNFCFAEGTSFSGTVSLTIPASLKTTNDAAIINKEVPPQVAGSEEKYGIQKEEKIVQIEEQKDEHIIMYTICPK